LYIHEMYECVNIEIMKSSLRRLILFIFRNHLNVRFKVISPSPQGADAIVMFLSSTLVRPGNVDFA
jgi:hypothetical protein